MREGQWLEQDAADHAEDRRVGADAECQRQQREGRDGRAAQQRADAEAHVLPEAVHRGSPLPPLTLSRAPPCSQPPGPIIAPPPASAPPVLPGLPLWRSEEHTSELQS